MRLKIFPAIFEVEAVIVYCFNLKGELVVLQKNWDDILYPGMCGTVAGKIKFHLGENKEIASKREIWEETGTIVGQDSIIYLERSFPTRHNVHATGESIDFMAHMMVCMEPLKTITLSREHRRSWWSRPTDILAGKFNCIPDAIDDLTECLPQLRKCIPALCER